MSTDSPDDLVEELSSALDSLIVAYAREFARGALVEMLRGEYPDDIATRVLIGRLINIIIEQAVVIFGEGVDVAEWLSRAALPALEINRLGRKVLDDVADD